MQQYSSLIFKYSSTCCLANWRSTTVLSFFSSNSFHYFISQWFRVTLNRTQSADTLNTVTCTLAIIEAACVWGGSCSSKDFLISMISNEIFWNLSVTPLRREIRKVILIRSPTWPPSWIPQNPLHILEHGKGRFCDVGLTGISWVLLLHK